MAILELNSKTIFLNEDFYFYVGTEDGDYNHATKLMLYSGELHYLDILVIKDGAFNRKHLYQKIIKKLTDEIYKGLIQSNLVKIDVKEVAENVIKNEHFKYEVTMLN